MQGLINGHSFSGGLLISDRWHLSPSVSQCTSRQTEIAVQSIREVEEGGPAEGGGGGGRQFRMTVAQPTTAIYLLVPRP